MDNFGKQIQATFFNEQAEQYERFLEENHVYTFSGGQIKIANQKFTSIKNEFCIVFDKNTSIELAKDDLQIKSQGFSFNNIREITDLDQMKTIDAIGCITQVGQLT
jgi:replication factor A1